MTELTDTERETLAEVVRHAYENESLTSRGWADNIARAVLAADWLAAHDAAIRAETLRDADRIKVRLLDALDWTEANFRTAVRGQPVRDMTENLAENAATRQMALRAAQPTEGES